MVLDAREAALVVEARCSRAEAMAHVLPGGHGRVGGVVARGMTIGGGGAASAPLPGAVSVDRGENLLCLWAVRRRRVRPLLEGAVAVLIARRVAPGETLTLGSGVKALRCHNFSEGAALELTVHRLQLHLFAVACS